MLVKIQVIKSFAILKILYWASLISAKKDFIKKINSGAPAALRAAQRSPILIWERKGNPSMNFLMVIMASGIARKRVRPGRR